MSLESLDNKEKSSLHLDSDSSWDKTSLAKSIPIYETENSKQEGTIDKDSENLKNVKNEEIRNSKLSKIISDKILNLENDSKEKEFKLDSLHKTANNHDPVTNIDNYTKNPSSPACLGSSEDNSNFICDNEINKKIDYNLQDNKSRVESKYSLTYNTTANEKAAESQQDQVKFSSKDFVYLVIQYLNSIDKSLSLVIHDLQLKRNMECLIYLFARLFNPDFITSYFIVILSYKTWMHSDYFFVLKPIISTVMCLAVTLFLKKYFGRSRPEYSKSSRRIIDLRRHEKNCSMPSGDSLQAGNFAVILYFYFNTTFGFFIVPIVMFARIYFYCHFLFDTIIGALLGIIISSLINNILYQI